LYARIKNTHEFEVENTGLGLVADDPDILKIGECLLVLLELEIHRQLRVTGQEDCLPEAGDRLEHRAAFLVERLGVLHRLALCPCRQSVSRRSN